MSEPDPALVRNIGIIAHIDAGKTTTTERILYYPGREHRLGNVDDGTTRTDFDPEEQDRGITIYSAAVTTEWTTDGVPHRITIIDTPGHVDFTAEVERSLRVLDGAIGIFCARGGVEAQSETVWHQADRYRVPRLAFVNKMDRAGADFDAVLRQLHERLGAKPLPIQLPVGAEDGFDGVLDLVTREWLWFDPESLGARLERRPVPAALRDECELAREQLLDRASAVGDEVFLEACLENRATPAQIWQALRAGTLAGAFTPVLCGASLRNKGVQPLLDAVCRLLPAPGDVPPTPARHPVRDQTITLPADPDGPPAALAFKFVAEAHRDLAFLRVYSGALERGTAYYNPRLKKRERLTQLFHVYADRMEAVDALHAGEIGAAVGLKLAVTGDTLCHEKQPLALEPLQFPEPVVRQRVEPRSSGERARLLAALERLGRQDPTFRAETDAETGELIICGMGELHLEVICHRLARDFHVEVQVGKPSVAYKETFAGPGTAEATFARAVAGKNAFARVRVSVVPHAARQAPVVALAAAARVELGESFAEAARRGLAGAVGGGGQLGFPLLHLAAEVQGGAAHPTDSTEEAFEAAAAMAFDEAVRRGPLALLWPVMRFEVRTPEESLGPITGDLNVRRAIITETGHLGPLRVVRGTVPIAEMFGYANAVRSLSGGRASYSLEVSHYDVVPPEVRRKFEG